MNRFYVIAAMLLLSLSPVAAKETGSPAGMTAAKADSRPGGARKEVTSVEQLHVYQLFGDKYKRHPDCVLTVIENQQSKYRELKVNNNAQLVKEIHALVEQDAALSTNVMRTYNQDSDQVIMNGAYGSIGYTEYLGNASCSIFISCQ